MHFNVPEVMLNVKKLICKNIKQGTIFRKNCQVGVAQQCLEMLAPGRVGSLGCSGKNADQTPQLPCLCFDGLT